MLQNGSLYRDAQCYFALPFLLSLHRPPVIRSMIDGTISGSAASSFAPGGSQTSSSSAEREIVELKSQIFSAANRMTLDDVAVPSEEFTGQWIDDIWKFAKCHTVYADNAFFIY